MPTLCEVSPIPASVRLGEVEALLLPRCRQGAILSIGRQGVIESAIVAFEQEADARA